MNSVLRTLTLGSVIGAALLSGCARSVGSPTDETTVAAKPTARTVAISADDTMKFNTTQIYARPGETLAITLTNKGAVPKAAMAHNWVLFQTDIDLNAVATQGMTSPATNFIPAAFAEQVISSTKLLGPNESDTTIVKVPTAAGRYPFICTFPGHMQAGMRGELIVE